MTNEQSSLVMVVHCYDQIGYSSLWFCRGVNDPTSNESVEVDDYPKHYQLIADHVENRLASDIADRLIAVLTSLGIDVQLFGCLMTEVISCDGTRRAYALTLTKIGVG